MKTKYLLPPVFKKIGLVLFLVCVIFSALFFIVGPDSFISTYHQYPDLEWMSPLWWFFFFLFFRPLGVILNIAITVSLSFMSLSREKYEDEYITNIRGNSIIWSLIVMTAVMILYVAIVPAEQAITRISLLSEIINCIYILFLMKFHISLHKLRKSARHEEQA